MWKILSISFRTTLIFLLWTLSTSTKSILLFLTEEPNDAFRIASTCSSDLFFAVVMATRNNLSSSWTLKALSVSLLIPTRLWLCSSMSSSCSMHGLLYKLSKLFAGKQALLSFHISRLFPSLYCVTDSGASLVSNDLLWLSPITFRTPRTEIFWFPCCRTIVSRERCGWLWFSIYKDTKWQTNETAQFMNSIKTKFHQIHAQSLPSQQIRHDCPGIKACTHLFQETNCFWNCYILWKLS